MLASFHIGESPEATLRPRFSGAARKCVKVFIHRPQKDIAMVLEIVAKITKSVQGIRGDSRIVRYSGPSYHAHQVLVTDRCLADAVNHLAQGPSNAELQSVVAPHVSAAREGPSTSDADLPGLEKEAMFGQRRIENGTALFQKLSSFHTMISIAG